MNNRILASLLKPTKHKWKEQLVYIDIIDELIIEKRTITSSSPGYHINKMVEMIKELKIDYLIYLRREVPAENEFENKYFYGLFKRTQEEYINGCVIDQDEFPGNTAKRLFRFWNKNKDDWIWLAIREAEFNKYPELDWSNKTWKSKAKDERQLSEADKQTIKEYGQTYFEECLQERNKQMEAIYENSRRELLLKPGEVLVMIDNNFYQFENYKDYELAKSGSIEEISLAELTGKPKKRKPSKRFSPELTDAFNSSHSQYSLTVGNEERQQRNFEMIKQPKDKWDWAWINNLKINRNETIKQGKITFRR